MQITPVAPGRSRVTTASKKDGGGGSQQAPRPGAVCSCNVDIENLQRVLLSQQKTGNRLASLGTSASASNVASVAASQSSKLQHASTSGTSLDLSSSVHQQQQQQAKTAAVDSLAKQSRELTNEELIKFLQELNGDLKWIDQAQLKQLTKDYEFLKAVVDRIIQQRNKQQSKTTSLGTQQQPTLAQQKPKSYHMSNGDVVSSLKQQQSHDKAHTLSRSKSALAAKQIHAKSFEAEQATIQSLLRSEFFDRTLDQRHSSRSAEGGRSKDDDWAQSKLNRQRHLSGPSDLSLLKDDISEWLLSLSLARKREKQLQQTQPQQSSSSQAPPPALPPKPGQAKPPSGGGESGGGAGATSKLRLQFKDELKEILKKPIQRQHSGPPDLAAIKNDLIQWLTKQQLADKNDRGREDLDVIRPAPCADRGSAAKSKSVPKLVKRHSLGPGEEVFFKASDSTAHPTTFNIQYQRIHRDKPNLIQLPSSCVDIHRNSDRTDHTVLSSSSAHHHRTQDRKLRHSASEVVTPTSERAPIQAGATSKTFHYEYQPKTSSKQHTTKQDSALKTHTHSNAQLSGDTSKDHRSRKDRTKRHTTQRSATVSEMEIQHKYNNNKKRSHSRSRTPQPWEPCTDPSCPYLPVCTDPNCYMNLYDTPRCASLPRTKEKVCASTCYECNNLCTASRCMQTKCKVKSNSLPRCVSTHRSSSHPTSLLRQTTTDGTTDGKSSLPRLKTAISKTHHSKQNGTNGKLIKSISAASLNSRRRRHKTVHFGENLLREVCQNRKLIKPLQDSTNQQNQPSSAGGTTTQLCQPNIQMLYNFVEGVLSAWVDEDDEHKSGPESEPERGALVKPLHRCNRIRFLTIKRIVNEAAELRGALKLGNSRFRHRHWRGTAKECNERFLKKVN